MTDPAHGPWKHPTRRRDTPWLAREGTLLAIAFAAAMIAALGLSAITGNAHDTPPTHEDD